VAGETLELLARGAVALGSSGGVETLSESVPPAPSPSPSPAPAPLQRAGDQPPQQQSSKQQAANSKPAAAAGGVLTNKIYATAAAKPVSHLERRRRLRQWWDESPDYEWEGQWDGWQQQQQQSWREQQRRWRREQERQQQREEELRQEQWEQEEQRVRQERELQLERERQQQQEAEERARAAHEQQAALEKQRQEQDAAAAAQRAQQAAEQAQLQSGLEALRKQKAAAAQIGARSRLVREVRVGSAGLAVALTARPQTQHTMLMPSPALGLPFTGSAALLHLEFDSRPWQLQQALLGGAEETQEAVGSAVGWLDAARLLPSAQQSGAGSAAATGVQFELTCERCWMLLDGAVIAGARGGARVSPCVSLPAASATGGGGTAALVQLEVQFTAKSLPVSGLLLRYRTCDVTAPDSGGSGSSGFLTLGAALAPGWVLAPSDLEGEGYREGLICEVAPAARPRGASPQAAATVYVPRRPGPAPGAGGLDPQSALRFLPPGSRHGSQAAFGDAALNVSALASALGAPEGDEDGEQEEEEAAERAERRRQRAEAAGQRAPADWAAPQLPPAADDTSLGPLTSFLNTLLASWWGSSGGATRRKLLGGVNSPGYELPTAAAGPRGRSLLSDPAEPPLQQQQRASRLLSLSAARLAPALAAAAAPGALFDVACWAYWNGTLAANATIGADPSGSLGAAEMLLGGARLATRAPTPTLIAGVGVDSVLTNWEEQRERASGASFIAPGGGVDFGAAGRRGCDVSGEGFSGGGGGLLRLLVMRWRGVPAGASLWVADARGPWELEPYSLWVPAPADGGDRGGADGGAASARDAWL
jgi:hypothetical protein